MSVLPHSAKMLYCDTGSRPFRSVTGLVQWTSAMHFGVWRALGRASCKQISLPPPKKKQQLNSGMWLCYLAAAISAKNKKTCVRTECIIFNLPSKMRSSVLPIFCFPCVNTQIIQPQTIIVCFVFFLIICRSEFGTTNTDFSKFLVFCWEMLWPCLWLSVLITVVLFCHNICCIQ